MAIARQNSGLGKLGVADAIQFLPNALQIKIKLLASYFDLIPFIEVLLQLCQLILSILLS